MTFDVPRCQSLVTFELRSPTEPDRWAPRPVPPANRRPARREWKSGPWAVSAHSAVLDDHAPPPCRRCGCELELHQPDPARPDALLGICAPCNAWHVIALRPGVAEICVIESPGRDRGEPEH